MVVPPNIESMRFNQLGFAEDVFYFLHGKSTTWGIYREYVLFFGGSLSKSMSIQRRLLVNQSCFTAIQLRSQRFLSFRSLHDAWVPGKFVLAFNGVLSNTSALEMQGHDWWDGYYICGIIYEYSIMDWNELIIFIIIHNYRCYILLLIIYIY